ncbi:MAG: LptF/LptG family permease, partial [Fusobacterium sp.]|nr:LptF/LptG family permease [Fusobacterium sp.]
MKIINKYILEELRGPVILSIFVFTFIFLLDIMVAMMENIIVKGISIIDILRLLSFYIPPILTQTIPIGLFLGIMICFSKFSRNSESVAMVSTGMSIKNILKPILYLALALSFFIIFLQESIIPRSFIKLKYLGAKIAYENPVFQLKEKTFIDTIDEYSIYVDEVDSNGKAKNVLIFEKNEKNLFPTVLVGEDAYWQDYSIIIEDAQFVNFNENGAKNLIGTFDEKKVSLAPFFE